jgi:hypothetical protein
VKGVEVAIKLGACDQGCVPVNAAAFFGPIHETTMKDARFRGEEDGEWRGFSEVPGSEIKELQRFLKAAGFFPHGKIDGICGYRTTASLRLFQEYVRTIEGDVSIGAADGVLGDKTRVHVQRWRTDGTQANWVAISPVAPTDEYRRWMQLLAAVKAHYLRSPTTLLKLVTDSRSPSDTLKVADWTFDPKRIHLLGIRRNEGTSGERTNDDVFVLLVNGIVFKFYGTTDPGKTENQGGAPFLVPGQHRYRFGWHKMSEMSRVYRALKPLRAGVLVVRDGNRDQALTESDITGELEPNPSINVHWGGRGVTNWSEGCQVICGKGYINHEGASIDCSSFAALRYAELGKRVNGVYMTKGAYSVLVDVITAFSGDVHAADYMLLYEQDLDLVPSIGRQTAASILRTIS